jgi:hypothetical protein
MYLKKLIKRVLFVIWNFETLLQELYNRYFAKFLQNYQAKLTENELLTSLYNKINDLKPKISQFSWYAGPYLNW